MSSEFNTSNFAWCLGPSSFDPIGDLQALVQHPEMIMNHSVPGAKQANMGVYSTLRDAMSEPRVLLQLICAYRGCCDAPIGDGKALLSCSRCTTTTCPSCVTAASSGGCMADSSGEAELTAAPLGCQFCGWPLAFNNLWSVFLSRRVWFLAGTEQERYRLHKALRQRLEREGFVVAAPSSWVLSFSPPFGHKDNKKLQSWELASDEKSGWLLSWDAELVVRCGSAPLAFVSRMTKQWRAHGFAPSVPSFVLCCQ